jgi:hypothetical protein
MRSNGAYGSGPDFMLRFDVWLIFNCLQQLLIGLEHAQWLTVITGHQLRPEAVCMI